MGGKIKTMDNVNYDMYKDFWYSPKEVIEKFDMLHTRYGTNIMQPEFKRAREMFAGAIALLGAFVLSEENVYFMQLNNQGESPDVMAVMQEERDNDGILAKVTQMEMVELGENSPETDVVEFLKKGKLNKKKKSYDKNTMIVCHVNKIIKIDAKDVSKRIAELKPEPSIYITGRAGEEKEAKFTIFTPHPIASPIVVHHVPTTMDAYFIPPRVTLHRSMEKKIRWEEEKIQGQTPYEMLGVNGELVKKKYPAPLL